MKTSKSPESSSEYKRFTFTYRFDGADWAIEIPALSLEEARERVKVLGFARYDDHRKRRRRRSPNGHGSSAWFRNAIRSFG
ncbi:hypothetical protein [Bauldia sp.]|uniref:hypothetical protein n=1 Tax=Bauldia sp. TaxID=2575872 RepID=UPI003BA892B4